MITQIVLMTVTNEEVRLIMIIIITLNYYFLNFSLLSLLLIDEIMFYIILVFTITSQLTSNNDNVVF